MLQKEIVNTLNDMSSVLSEYIEKEKVEKVISYQVDKGYKREPQICRYCSRKNTVKILWKMA